MFVCAADGVDEGSELLVLVARNREQRYQPHPFRLLGEMEEVSCVVVEAASPLSR